jgi:putative acetyltransferase
VIRRYRPDDLASVLDVWSRSAREAYDFLDEPFFAAEADAIEHEWMPVAETWVFETGAFETGISETGVSETDARVVGFIALLDHEVGGFFVDPAWQGRGVGRALMDHARELKGALELGVFAENAKGRRFYERYGFVLDGEQIEEQTGHRELRLRLPRD